jgi:hypothetical protein
LISEANSWPREDREKRKYDPRVDPFQKEKELQEWLRNGCRRLGLLYYHTHISKNSPSGFPDAQIAAVTKKGNIAGIIITELKMPWNPNPTADQKAWLNVYAGLRDLLNVYLMDNMDEDLFFGVCVWTSDDITEMSQTLALLANVRSEMEHSGY